VTATAVLEAIAGDLPEHGQEDSRRAVQRADGTLLVDGMMDIDDFAKRIGTADLREDGSFETVAGFVVHHLGRIPEVGEKLERPDMSVEVVDMDGRRIDKLLVTLKATPQEQG
jgi:putative hemolysin